MTDWKPEEDRTSWAVAGGLMMGLGVGFFFVQKNPMAFVGCTLGGLGLGLLVTSILSTFVKKD